MSPMMRGLKQAEPSAVEQAEKFRTYMHVPDDEGIETHTHRTSATRRPCKAYMHVPDDEGIETLPNQTRGYSP